MRAPAISVVMPVYNGEKHLAEAIDSILNQTFSDFEFIIINDCSTDETDKIILSYNDPRIIYIKNEENLKIVQTLNKGIALANGKYIARMDADDISVPERFSIQLKAIEELGADVLGSAAIYFGDRKWSYVKKMPETMADVSYCMLSFCPLIHPTIIARAEVLKENTYPQGYAEDLALWMQLITRGYKILNIPDVCLNYRISNMQTSFLNKEKSAKTIKKLKSEYCHEFYGVNSNEYESFLNDLFNNITIEKLNFWINWFITIGLEKNVNYKWIRYSVKNILRKTTSNFMFGVNAFRSYREYLNLVDLYYMVRINVGRRLRQFNCIRS